MRKPAIENEWFLTDDSSIIECCCSDADIIINIAEINLYDEEESKQNARMLAAAPELYRALKNLAELYTRVTGLPAVEANKVFKKAEGGI
jgi:hypothetical protein